MTEPAGSLAFTKMEGLGNDFVVLEGPRQVTAEAVAAWCDRRRGIGADGVLVVTPLEGDPVVRMEYWNADGSPAEMCGNGLRCVARFAHDRSWAGTSFRVDTPVGVLPVEILGPNRVRAKIGAIGDLGVAPFDMAGYQVQPISVGNPHAVVVVNDCYTTPVEAVGPLVETDPHFPDRANVEFATVVDRGTVALRVWERGVGETLACGTGAAAAVAVTARSGLTDSTALVMLPGGTLRVEIGDDGVWLDGAADVVFDGRWPLGATDPR
jgi:diaminopimelate epimerase